MQQTMQTMEQGLNEMMGAGTQVSSSQEVNTPVSSGISTSQYTTVRAAVRAGENYLRQGDRANAQKCLDRAIALMNTEDDYEEIEDFAREMAQ